MEKMVLNIVGASAYSFTDDKTGRVVEGVNVFHLVKGHQENNSVGMIPSKITLPFTAWGRISTYPFPCDCEVITEQEFGRKGIVTKVSDIVLPVKKM